MPEHIRQEPKVLVSTENLTEQEWLAYRRRGIGGSDVAAIFGISPFRTARDLYDDKLNIASAADDAGNWVALEMGHLFFDRGGNGCILKLHKFGDRQVGGKNVIVHFHGKSPFQFQVLL